MKETMNPIASDIIANIKGRAYDIRKRGASQEAFAAEVLDSIVKDLETKYTSTWVQDPEGEVLFGIAADRMG